jgi:hypothetical protein
MKMSDEDKEEYAERLSQGIPRFKAIADKIGAHCGYENGQEYHRPMSRYQRWMRAEMGDEDVTYHYTAKFGAKIVER